MLGHMVPASLSFMHSSQKEKVCRHNQIPMQFATRNTIEFVVVVINVHDVGRLLATTKSQHQVQSALLLNVVVRESATILQLLSCEDQSLLVGWDTFLVLNL